MNQSMRKSGGAMNFARLLRIAATALGSLGSVALAAPGDLDPYFGSAGEARFLFNTSIVNRIDAVAIAPDGKLLVGGYAANGGIQSPSSLFGRYQTNGAEDVAVYPGGYLHSLGAEYARAVLYQPDGKYLVAGYKIAPPTGFYVKRFTTSNNGDVGFGSFGLVTTSLGSGTTGGVEALALQSDGKIVAAGYGLQTTEKLAVARYNTNGTLDSSFGTGGIVLTPLGTSAATAQAVAVQSDGKILVAGKMFNAGIWTGFVARLTSTGAFDTSFCPLTPPCDGYRLVQAFNWSAGSVSSIALQSDGKILLSGSASKTDGNSEFFILRVTSSGGNDSFGSLGFAYRVNVGIPGAQRGLAVQSDGRILIAGRTGSGAAAQIRVLRYTAAGALDATFGASGEAVLAPGSTDAEIGGLALQSDGQIVVVGGAANGFITQAFLARLDTAGALDATFGMSGVKKDSPVAALESARRIRRQADGKLILAGTYYNQQLQKQNVALARMDVAFGASGQLDPTFGTGGKVIFDPGTIGSDGSGRVGELAILPDGRLLIAGCKQIVGIYNFTVYRATATGAEDAGGEVSYVHTDESCANAIVVQPDGKYVAGGYVTTAGGTKNYFLARFYDERYGDPSFSIDGNVTTDVAPGYNDEIMALALQPDGKIVAVGTLGGSGNHISLVRYNANGTLDSGFGTGGIVSISTPSFTYPSSVAVNADGKILVHADRNSPAQLLVLRRNADGSADTSFGVGGTASSASPPTGSLSAADMKLLSSGKILLLGRNQITTPVQSDDIVLARFTADGLPDETFAPGGMRIHTTGAGETEFGLAFDVSIAENRAYVVGSDRGNTNTDIGNIFSVWAFQTGDLIDTTIDSGPSGYVASTSATFNYSANFGTGFSCRLDGAGWNPFCGGGTSSTYSFTGLSQGSHTFEVRANNLNLDLDDTPATRTWIVDTIAPDTAIDSGPTGTVSETSATFTFSSPDGATFECSLDAGSFVACTSPKDYIGLAAGAHSVQVRAIDLAGNPDATPASRAWTIAAAPGTARPRDLSGDGKSDVLLRGPSGEIVAWLMNGDVITASTLMLGGGTGYQATQFGDFNGDGKMDLLVVGASGELVLWLMNGDVVTSSTLLLGGGSGYVVDKLGDFNGDGKSDILFKGAGGDLVVWLMDGATIAGNAAVQGTGTGFAPAVIGDFDNDGKDDIAIAHTDGRITMWLMNGTTIASSVNLLGAGSGYVISHVGDFNSDSKDDLMLKGPAGEIAMWQMDGATIASSVLLYGGGPWQISQIADVNGDGMDDMVLKGPAGEIVIWEMNGATITGATLMYGGGPWQVTHVGDYDGDGKSDLLLKGPGGEIVVWVMNGSTITSATLLVGATTWQATP